MLSRALRPVSAGGAQSATIPVTLAGGPGLVEGTLTIDTTEVTSADAGHGSDDGDDVVTFTALALTPSLASLDSAVPTISGSIDLGEVAVGQSSGLIGVPVWNLADPALGATLDVDSVSITGMADGVTLLGAPVLGVPGGTNAMLMLDITPTTPGEIIAVATIDVSDEDLPGETQSQLTLMITATATDPCPADVNGDGFVEPGDFNAWVFAYLNELPGCDQNGDGVCLPDDFNMWIFNYTAGCP